MGVCGGENKSSACMLMPFPLGSRPVEATFLNCIERVGACVSLPRHAVCVQEARERVVDNAGWQLPRWGPLIMHLCLLVSPQLGQIKMRRKHSGSQNLFA